MDPAGLARQKIFARGASEAPDIDRPGSGGSQNPSALAGRGARGRDIVHEQNLRWAGPTNAKGSSNIGGAAARRQTALPIGLADLLESVRRTGETEPGRHGLREKLRRVVATPCGPCRGGDRDDLRNARAEAEPFGHHAREVRGQIIGSAELEGD